LSLDPILLVLLELMIFRQKGGGAGPPRNESGGLGLCGPPGSATYDYTCNTHPYASYVSICKQWQCQFPKAFTK